MKKQKRLFPCDTSRLAIMEETDEYYIISGEYDNKAGGYQSRFYVDKQSPTAELEAWNAYIGALDTAVNRRLRERPKAKSYIAELIKRVMEEVENDEIPAVQMPPMWRDSRNGIYL